MTTTYATATTLDGYLADDHDSLDWLFVQDIDEEGPNNHGAFMEGVGSLVMGATTYLWVLDHLATSGEAWPYASLPSWVMTHRDLPTPDGADIRFATADDEMAVKAVHADLVEAADGKDVWVVGGGALAADFAAAGLLDDIVVSIAPVTLGSGRPLLPRPFDLELLELDRNRAFVVARFRVVGPR
ncbi:dihydrofolate reductase family protein [Euzebya pacifica]|uniref:dihydrofolate reductase family protein n=1 Tax=Euzebya pacifica TaxID=1608957 RepID=UPI0030F8AFFC